MRPTLRAALIVPALAILLLLSSYATLAAQEGLDGQVPNSGAWAHYLVTRCATYSGGPFIIPATWPGTTLYAYVRDPFNNNPLGPTQQWNVGDQTWRDMGDLGNTQCFNISARKDFTGFGGTSNWTGTIDY